MNYFSTCHIVLGLGKQQELPNKKCKTVEDAHTPHLICIFGPGPFLSIMEK
jgi:hypothetical protein